MRSVFATVLIFFGHYCNAQKLSLTGKIGVSFAQAQISERSQPEPLFNTPHTIDYQFAIQLQRKMNNYDFLYVGYRYQTISISFSGLANSKPALLETILGGGDDNFSSSSAYDFKALGVGYKKDLWIKKKKGRDYLSMDINIGFFDPVNFDSSGDSFGDTYTYVNNLSSSIQSGKKTFPFLSLTYSHNFLNKKGKEIFGFDFNYSYSPVKFVTTRLSYYNNGLRYPSTDKQHVLFTNKPNAFTFSLHKTIRILK